MRPRARALLLLTALAVALALFGDALARPEGLVAGDLAHFYYPLRARLAEAIRAGSLLAWDPLVGCGRPFLADPVTQSLYPPTLLCVALGAVAGLKAFIAIHAAIAAATMGRLARALGASAIAAAAAGAIYAASGPIVGAHWHLPFAAALAWLPLVLEGAHGLAAPRPPRRALARVAAGVALVALAGAFDLLYAIALIAGALVLARALSRRPPAPPTRDASAGEARRPGAASPVPLRALARLAAAGLLGAALAAPQILPTLELVRESSRRALSDAERALYSLEPRALAAEAVGLAAPPLVGRLDPVQQGEGRFLTATYLGAPALLLGAIGLAPASRARRRSRRAPPVLRALLAALALGAALLSLGPSGPLFGPASLLPGVRLFRYPEKFLVLAPLGLAPLAALGLDALRARLRGSPGRRRRAARLLAAALALATGVDLVIRARAGILVAPASQIEGTPRAVDVVRELDREAALRAATTGGAAGAPFEPGRVSRMPGLGLTSAAPEPNVMALFGNRDADSYSSLDLAGYDALRRSLGAEALFRRLGADKVAVPVAGRPEAVQWARFDGAWPRAFVARAPDGEPAADLGAARISSESSAAVEVAVDATAPGELILLDNDYPGWRATLDGAPAPIVRSQGAFRAVAIPAPGRHVVRFDFTPRALHAGLGLSALAAAVALALRRRRRRPER